MNFHLGESVKKHPALWAGGAAVAVVLVIIIVASGGKGTPAQTATGPDYSSMYASDVAANSAITQAQLQAQTASNQIAGSVQVGLAQIAQQTNADTLNAQTNAAAIAMQGNVQLASIAAQKDTQNLVSTLSAQVSSAQIAATQALGENNNATQVQLQQIVKAMNDSNNQVITTINANNNATQLGIVTSNNATTVATGAQNQQVMDTYLYVENMKNILDNSLAGQANMYNAFIANQAIQAGARAA